MVLIFLFLSQYNFNFNVQDFPDASGIIVQDIIQLDVDKDFKTEQNRTYKVYILNTRGRERYSDIFEKFNNKDESLDLINAQTVLPNGEILKPEPKAISDLGTVEGFLAPAYKDLRTRTVSYSGVGQDAVLEYKSRKRSKTAPEDKSVFGTVLFQRDDPILHKEFTLKIPKTTDLKYEIYGNIKVKKIEEDGFCIFQWLVDSMSRLKDEPHIIPLKEFAPRIVYTNFNSWQEVGNWLWKKFEKSIIISKAMEEATKSFKKSDKDSLIKELYTLVTKNWRDIPLGISDAGYTPTRTDEVYTNRYGNPIDKCGLIIAMLRACGIEAFPAYISYSKIEDRLPMPGYLDGILVALSLRDTLIYLDPRFPETEGSFFDLGGILCKFNAGFQLSPDVLERRAFIVKPDTIIFTITPNYKKPIANLAIDIKITEDGSIKGKCHTQLKGISAMRARLALRGKKDKELKIGLEKVLGSLKIGTTLTDFQIMGLDDPLLPVEILVGFSTTDYLVKQGDNLKFYIPEPLFSYFDMKSVFNIARRENPFTVIHQRSVYSELKVSFPEKFGIVYKPAEMAIDNELASAMKSYKLEGKTITIKNSFEFKKADYKPEEFPLLASVYESIASINQQFLIFKKE